MRNPFLWWSNTTTGRLIVSEHEVCMWYKHLPEMNHDVYVCLCCVNTIKMDDFLFISDVFYYKMIRMIQGVGNRNTSNIKPPKKELHVHVFTLSKDNIIVITYKYMDRKNTSHITENVHCKHVTPMSLNFILLSHRS